MSRTSIAFYEAKTVTKYVTTKAGHNSACYQRPNVVKFDNIVTCKYISYVGTTNAVGPAVSSRLRSRQKVAHDNGKCGGNIVTYLP